MSNKKPWSRNQKILVAGILISLLFSLINLGFLIKNSNQQIIIRQEVDDLKTKSAEIGNLIVDEFYKRCPENTSTTTFIFENGVRIECN